MDPYLPPELEREIFENAALLHPGTIPGLLLVAQRVFECPWLAAELRLILASCPGITDFVMMSTTPSAAVLPLLENKRLKRIFISLAQLFGNGAILRNLSHPVFLHTTHLALFDQLHNEQAWPHSPSSRRSPISASTASSTAPNSAPYLRNASASRCSSIYT
ncbi:hypothetical protein DFH09DRAFT_1356482 [Mycena vulgaris]|nr:hypothetical protein DFH09DRAFT_1356482 [Mycena vulgaris]